MRLLTRGSWSESQRFSEILRRETVGGVLLLVAAGAALVWANSPWAQTYRAMSEFEIGPDALHLQLNISAWAADGLLAIFFFVVGLELKREFVAGDLRDPRRAALPIAAAMGGMVVPAAVYIGINMLAGHPENIDGWAVPIATDIAFALAVLAVLSTHLPTALRTFLLTLAVVDDLLAITVIAIFYTDHLSPAPLALALIPIGLFGWYSAACTAGGCCCRWPSRHGRWCMPAGCTQPWPASSWGSRSPCSADVASRLAELFEQRFGRSLRASPCRCSRSSPRE